MSQSEPGISGSASPSSHEDLELSEGWLAEIFNDADMEVSSDYMNVSGDGDDLSDVSELLETQPAHEQHDLGDGAELHDTQPANEHVLVDGAELLQTHPAHEQHDLSDVAELLDPQLEHEQLVVQQHVSRSHPILVLKGMKSVDQTPTKSATSVAYPFAYIKPGGAQGDVTLKEINQRIQSLPSPKPKPDIEDPSSCTISAFSGKPVASKVKIHTKGKKGSITVVRTIG